jgi:hypothetical protein
MGTSDMSAFPQSGWLTARAARLIFLARALVPFKLFLEIGLGVYRLAQGCHGNFKFLAANRAYADYRCRAEPFDDPEIAFRHVSPVHHPRLRAFSHGFSNCNR